ncbi:MAG: hypothetical protein H6R01_1046 [Burkholderiaceae bacterium]|nr:hypothetical protein [Burkholderiaceae bacterium]
MSNLTLSSEELENLTGYKMPSCQVRWLKERHWRFELSRANRPRVAREYYLMKMGVTKSYDAPNEPNWGALAAG